MGDGRWVFDTRLKIKERAGAGRMTMYDWRNLGRIVGNFIIFTLLLVSTLYSQEKISSDSATRNGNSFVALPYVFYTPETKIAIGVGSIYSYRPDGKSGDVRPSSIKFSATYTQQKQIIFSFIPEIYLKDENYYYSGFYTYYKYPDKFWGIGNKTPDDAEEDFEPNLFRTFTNFQKRFFPGFYLGLRYQYESISLKETEENGVLRSGSILGSEGGQASGIGFLTTYDTRDNIFYPTRGQFHQIYFVFYDRIFGSDFLFNFYSFDLRKYFSINKTHVLAFQTYNVIVSGTPPFQMYPLLGGTYWMRGYYLGRYRDKNMITFQTEYRFPVGWRFGGVCFFGFGDVANKVADFKPADFKYSFGLGLRFMFDKQEKINARLDFGYTKDGDFGVYAMVVEAF